MTKIASRRLLGQSPLSTFFESASNPRLASRWRRPASNTSRGGVEDVEPPQTPPTTSEQVSDRPTVPVSKLADADEAPSFPPSNLESKLASDANEAASSSCARSDTPSRPRQSSFGFKRGGSTASNSFGQRISSEEANKRLLNLSSHMMSEQQTTKWPSIFGAAAASATPGSLYAHMNKEATKDNAWQMHIYAHRHNLHILVNRPPAWRDPETGKVYGATPIPHRTPALSVTAGSLGFRKSGRKHFDTAFQLGAYAMAKMKDSGMNENIESLEVYLRGFGQGREAVTRILLGPEGRPIRNKIIKVADATRLKFGGTRSKKPRRLG